jgi:hypothetical protein
MLRTGLSKPVLSRAEGPRSPALRQACPEYATVSSSTELTTGSDKPVLRFVEGLRMNGWHIEGLRPSVIVKEFRSHYTNRGALHALHQPGGYKKVS